MLISKVCFVSSSRVFLSSQSATVSSSHSRACSAVQGASRGTVFARVFQEPLDAPEIGRVRLVGGPGESQTGERQDDLTLVVAGKGRDAEFLGERQDARLAGADPLPAPLDDVTSADRVIERPAADAIPRLEHADCRARCVQLPRRRQPRQPRPDDRHVHLAIREPRKAVFPRP